jgi:hypothetical protein
MQLGRKHSRIKLVIFMIVVFIAALLILAMTIEIPAPTQVIEQNIDVQTLTAPESQ